MDDHWEMRNNCTYEIVGNLEFTDVGLNFVCEVQNFAISEVV